MESTNMYTKIAMAVSGAFAYLFGTLDLAMQLLLMVTIADFILGVIGSIVNKCVSSKKGIYGATKKIGIIIMVMITHRIDILVGLNGVLRYTSVCFYCYHELTSIVENLGVIGVPLPPKLKAILEQLRSNGDKAVMKKDGDSK